VELEEGIIEGRTGEGRSLLAAARRAEAWPALFGDWFSKQYRGTRRRHFAGQTLEMSRVLRISDLRTTVTIMFKDLSVAFLKAMQAKAQTNHDRKI
jgi:hypothetical protein